MSRQTLDDLTDHTGAFSPSGREAWSVGEQLPVVRLTSGSELLRHAVLEEGRGVVIGRDPGLDLTLDDPNVSRRHALVAFDGNGLTLTDLGSTNGTWRDGKRISGAVRIDFGERFQIGKATLRVERMSETEIAHLERVVRRLDTARNDPLTGLLTRSWVEDGLPAMVQHHEGMRLELSALFLDIDHFKSINDTWGHGVGDLTLKTAASLVALSIRGSDAAVRWGGEEFVVFLSNCGQRGAVDSGERIRRRIEAHDWRTIGIDRQVTISVGAALRAPGEPTETWLARADQGLYQAKRTGRNQTVFAPLTSSLRSQKTLPG